MGLSLHYRGKLKNAPSLQSLIEEAVDFAKIEQWDFFVFEEQFKNDSFSESIDTENLYGVMLIPPKSEPLCLSFLSNGRMVGLMNFNVLRMNAAIDDLMLYTISTKTQFTTVSNHKKIVLFLDHISQNYLTDFECSDEGYFWETRDETLLEKTFEKYTQIIDNFSSSLEMIPMEDGETIEEYLIRIANVTAKNQEESPEEEPKLSIEEEIEFKKMKLSLEYDTKFMNIEDNIIPPEIENQFLDQVIQFESLYENAKRITVYEKLGRPKYEEADNLNDEEIAIEVDNLFCLLNDYQIHLDIICEYENQDRLIYSFITQELFETEIDDLSIPGMFINFTYEDFHPNHKYDIEKECINFIKYFLDIEDDFYEEFHAKETKNHVELNQFRDLFEEFGISQYRFGSIQIEDEEASADFYIDFWGKPSGIREKTSFSGTGRMTFRFEHNYWNIQEVRLPI